MSNQMQLWVDTGSLPLYLLLLQSFYINLTADCTFDVLPHVEDFVQISNGTQSTLLLYLAKVYHAATGSIPNTQCRFGVYVQHLMDRTMEGYR